MVALFGRYEYRRELGRGATGRVFAVCDLAEAGVERAIKVVAPAEAPRLVWEFARLCRVEHPRVARVRELLRVEAVVHAPFGLPAGSLLLVEDLGAGSPLSRLGPPAREPAQQADFVLRVALGAAQALAAIHDAGLVHGDVKPDNLLVDDDAGVTLVDLGFAAPAALGDAPRGTPRYMAPELFAGVRSPAADVYALGGMLFDWISGEAAERGSSHTGGAFVARNSTALEGLIPAALVQVIDSFLQRDPALRPADGHAALSALVPVAETQGLAAARGAALFAGLSSGAASAEACAARARTLPFTGHTRLVARVAHELDQPGVLLVRGVRGAGRSRLVREALRRLQLDCADGGRPLPTVVHSFDALARLREVHTVLWLAPEGGGERELESALGVAALAERKLSVVIESEPLLCHAQARHIDVGPLDEDAQRELLARLLQPVPLSTAVCAAVASASQGFAGRLCELVAEALLEARDLSDPRSFQGRSWDQGELLLSAPALQLAGMFAWWGAGLVPGLCAHAQLAAEQREAAFAELWAKALLVEGGGGLTLAPFAARHVRRRTRDACGPLLAALGAQAEPESGFALLALDRAEEACRVFERDALVLRGQGNVEAARALLEEAAALTSSARLRLLWADAERACAHYEPALAALGEDASGEALLLRAEIARLCGKRDAARTCLAQLFGMHADDVAEVVRVRARALSARLSFDAGELLRARSEAEALGDSSDGEAAVRAGEVRLLVELASGLPEAQSADALVAQAAALRSERAQARVLSLRAQLRARIGERAGALSDAHAALSHARRAGEAHEAASCALNLGLLRWEAGELGLALETLRESAYRLSRIDRPSDLARVLFNVGALSLLVGDDTRAQAVLAHAERLAGPSGDPAAQALIAVAQAELALRRGQLEVASARLSSALSQLPAGLLPQRAVLAARAAQVWLLRDDLMQARELVTLARASLEEGDVAVALEVRVAEIRVLLASADAAAAEGVARAGMESVTARAPFAERVRFLLAAIDAARAAEYEQLARERGHLCRALLEAALSGLSPALRARMRERPEYARVLAAAGPAREEGDVPRASRWRQLVVASRRLFSTPHRRRIVERVAEIALELVHAERALVVACAEQGALEVRAQATLSHSAEAPVFSRSVVERVANERTPLVTVEASDDLRLSSAQSIHTLSVRSVLAVPIEAPRERMVLYLDDRLRAEAFGPDDLALVEDLAALAQQALRAAHARHDVARRATRAEQEVSTLTRAFAQSAPGESAPLIGVSRVLSQAIANARRIARSDVPVLVTGESGTGKELMARLIHDESPRRARPFVAESCAALPDTLLESALFGHVRGAFTGADRARRGLFEIADRGTLFLDEVGEMSQPLQSKLLRVLQEGEFRAVGSERSSKVDVRVLAATRRDLVARVRDGQFREDLYYRLAVVTLELPALAARREDIPLLVRHFVDKHGAGRKVRVSSAALRAFAQRDYPGNVRQLENEVRRALALCDDERIDEHDLPGAPALAAAHDPARELDLHAQVDALTERLVEQALTRAGGNVTRAAELLGISRFGLQKMLKRRRPTDQRK
jgi:transcriptional regulator with GAF, ATPase, and Fis domain